MDWKNYEVEPREGMFDKIEHRLRVRRAWRIGAASAAALLVAAVLLLLKTGNGETDSQLAMAKKSESAIQQGEIQTQGSVLQQSSSAVQPKEVVINTADKKQTVEETDKQPGELVVDAPSAADDDVNVASLLPQTSLAVKPVDVADLESNTRSINCAPLCIVPAEEKDTTSPMVVVPSFDAPKADPPQPAPYHEDNLLWVPNIIYPGSDIESNRHFRVTATSTLSDFHVHIYNRSGRLLFTSNDPAFAWNATFGGTPVPQGAYVWVISYRDTYGQPCQRTGTVTVVR